MESLWTQGNFISKGSVIGTETPRLSGQDSESSRNRNQNLNLGSPGLRIGTKAWGEVVPESESEPKKMEPEISALDYMVYAFNNLPVS